MEPYAHLKTAQELREEGNREFKGGRYDAAAATCYRAALREGQQLGPAPLQPRALLREAGEVSLCVQAATACLAAPSCDAATARKALLQGSRAYRASPHRRAEADLDHARADLERALETDPANKVLRRELAGLLNGEAVTDAALPDAPALQLSLTEAELAYGRDEAARGAATRRPRRPGAARGVRVQQRLADARRGAGRARRRAAAEGLRRPRAGVLAAARDGGGRGGRRAARARRARADRGARGRRRPGRRVQPRYKEVDVSRPGPCGAWRRACTRSRPGSWTTTRGTLAAAASLARHARARAATRWPCASPGGGRAPTT